MPSISRYDPRNRYRQRSQQRMSLMAGLALMGVVSGGVGYGIGYQSARMDQSALKTDMAAIQAEKDRLQQTVTRLMADSYSANVKYQQIEQQLQSELPQEGPLKDIVREIRDQLTAGVAPERIASLVRTLSAPKNCSDPEVRRFIVQTEKNKAADNTLLLAEGAISIKASGESSRGKDKKEEAWYDPSRPISLDFSWKDEKGPQTLERKNNLPISQVITVNGREYRMTFTEGAKSFLKVTFDSCDNR